MRLLNTATGQLEEFVGRNVPPYAALSHTWTESEVSLQQWSSLCSSSAAALPLPPDPGTDKILATCHLAAQDGLGHAWADTCCIDKSSSAELSEAINSMHAWYARSAICYVHLADLDPGGPADLETALPRCRWFTRGWTLQELIAPARVVFFDSSWTARAEKRDIVDLLARITGIRRGVLSHAVPLAALPTAEKMAWAARRQTTRLEDAAYCLLGLFGINMPLLYGEQERAFRRLQEEIMRTTTDLSIFAWQLPASSVNNGHHNNASSEFTYSGFLAPSPEAFYPCRITSKMAFGHEEEFSVTNCGIKTRIRIYLHMAADNPANKTYLSPAQWHGLRGQVVQLYSVGAIAISDFWPAARCDSQQERLGDRIRRRGRQ
ncbi:hypothetical protein PWT90_09521 [Aphanocladium album]|nr:hypothetical protein PWT90_09521 [Aphanocladium album]